VQLPRVIGQFSAVYPLCWQRMRTLSLFVLALFFSSVFGSVKHEEKLKSVHSRTRSKLMLRSMNEEQSIEILAHFWNNAGGQTRLSLMRTLFDGYPPPRLTSIEELMKLNYPVKTTTQQAAQFSDLFQFQSEREQFADIESITWPKLSLQNHLRVWNFLQLSTSERSQLRQMSHPIVEGNVFDTGAIEVGGQYFDLCDKGQTCDAQTPSCISLQGKSLCVKQCVGDPNCFSFIDPSTKRSWPGKCILTQKVCEGFSYYDPTQDKDVAVPFGGKAKGNGWGSAEAGLWSWSAAPNSCVVQIFSFFLPILLVLCINL